MNCKKIAKFIKDARHLTIWNSDGLQYISDGAAVYPVFGMPKMKEMEMLNFLGLADKSNVISVVMKDVAYFYGEIRTNRMIYTAVNAVLMQAVHHTGMWKI